MPISRATKGQHSKPQFESKQRNLNLPTMAPTVQESSSTATQQQWNPLSGILGRMACCAVPSEAITDMVVMEDQSDGVAVERQRQRTMIRPLSHRAGGLHDLPSPTLSPARRDLERWEPPPQSAPVSPICYAESTATASTFPSEDELYEEIKSNATTEVVSHRHRELLASSLATAEKQLRQLHEERRQDAEELQAYHYLTRHQPESGKQKL